MRRNAILALIIGVPMVLPLHAQDANRPDLPLSYKRSQQLKDKQGAVRQLGCRVARCRYRRADGSAASPAARPRIAAKVQRDHGYERELRSSNELRLMSPIELVRGLRTSSFAPEATPAQLWSNLANVPPEDLTTLAIPCFFTDGTVIFHRTDTTEWYKLTPDMLGSYVNGSWSKIASKPSNYAPKFFASAVLPDGRVIAEGGEYNLNQQDWTSLGAIYDPAAGAAGKWTAVAPPAGWTQIGDGQAAVLANGTFMLADCCDGPPFRAALLNPTNLTWTPTGANKADPYDEEGWTLLPDGSLLTVDSYAPIGGMTCGTGTEIYNPSTGTWSSAGNLPSQLADCSAANADGGNPSYEMGPQVLMNNGKVIAFGGTTAHIAHTALYDIATKKWTQGPDLPSVCGASGNLPCSLADAPATLLPNGRVLFTASAGLFKPPANFFEYDPASNAIKAVPGTADASAITSFYENFVVLPTGQILAVENYTSTVQIYSPSGSAQDSWRPTITSSPSCIARGGSYQLNGMQLNGLSQAASYGDDQQAATNYPLVRIVNNSTSHVFYARTSGHSTMTVAPNAPGSTHFSVSAAGETGPSTLYVVANGIASLGRPVTVAASSCPAQ